MTHVFRQIKFDSRAVSRFATFGVLIGIANIVPYLISRNAYRTDGLAVAGFPFRCYEKGGIDGHSWFGLLGISGKYHVCGDDLRSRGVDFSSWIHQGYCQSPAVVRCVKWFVVSGLPVQPLAASSCRFLRG